ncbi:probable E3 SUMO-protein ligase RNF212 isoform X6 [Lepus europaeus]|uniref:probable E3 SUMO-protein ligase RNF212 isoform X6 n=1 Tax=Lepus europaeus TaxID=9983 RepID=UPI002B499003|nr:probable E3 SUMO-protein ligase RNF212 isoform X6 [Lepus europaeus]
MAGWVFCNRCFQPPRSKSRFSLTNCGHVYCDGCRGQGKKDECLICKVPCRTVFLSKNTDAEIQAFFMGIDSLCRKYSQETSQPQPEVAAGPTRMSLISPPQDGRMGSVSYRGPQHLGLTPHQTHLSKALRHPLFPLPTAWTHTGSLRLSLGKAEVSGMCRARCLGLCSQVRGPELRWLAWGVQEGGPCGGRNTEAWAQTRTLLPEGSAVTASLGSSKPWLQGSRGGWGRGRNTVSARGRHHHRRPWGAAQPASARPLQDRKERLVY